ncbi:MAG: Rieske (2Fe-2S) protein [Actinomycetes bacterium]
MSAPPPEPPLPPGLTRRGVLGAAVVVAGAAGLLTACGGGSSAGGTSSAAGSAPAASAGGGGTALAKTSEVPVGSGVIIADKKVVVTQPTAGQFKGFSAICTHQACPVDSIKGDTISCPCHGSQYSAKDGSVKAGPAPRPLKEIPVRVEGDEVVEA